MTPAIRRCTRVRPYLAEATLPSEPLIFSFSLVPSVFTTSISYLNLVAVAVDFGFRCLAAGAGLRPC